MTDLEQLTRIISNHLPLAMLDTGETRCRCLNKYRGIYAWENHIAQAILDAGWTPPVPEFQRKINQAIVNRAAAELGIIPHRFVIGIDQQTTPSYLDN